MPSHPPGHRRLHKRLVAWARSESFSFFHLVLLFTLLLVQPLRGQFTHDRIVTHVALAGVIATGIISVGHRRWRMVVAILLGLPMVVLGVKDPDGSLIRTVVALSSGGLYMAFCTWGLLHDLFRARRVTAGNVASALSAYIMLGLTWAFAYALLVEFDPSAVTGLGAINTVSQGEYLGSLIYFSLITMTTVGYGDMVPLSDMARAMVEIQALGGQIVLVVLVSRLVGMQVAASMMSAEGGGRDKS